MVFHEICRGQHFISRLLTSSQANCTSFSTCSLYKSRWVFPKSGRSKKNITSEKLNMQVVKLCINILMAITCSKSVSASNLKNQWSVNDLCSKCAMIRIYNAGDDSIQHVCDMILKAKNCRQKSISLLWIKLFVEVQSHHYKKNFQVGIFLRPSLQNLYTSSLIL